MKLASLKGGRDGRLVVVSRDLSRYLPAMEAAPTLQAARSPSRPARPMLEAIASQVESGAGESFDEQVNTFVLGDSADEGDTKSVRVGSPGFLKGLFEKTVIGVNDPVGRDHVRRYKAVSEKCRWRDEDADPSQATLDLSQPQLY